MPKLTSCGVVILDTHRRVLACHATGTSRWDLPKGILDAAESPANAAVRETWEETGLRLDPASLHDLGRFDYLPAKRLHLFALRVADGAFDIGRCRCRSTWRHPRSGREIPEVDGHAWKAVGDLPAWCGKHMARVLGELDWAQLDSLPVTSHIAVDEAA